MEIHRIMGSPTLRNEDELLMCPIRVEEAWLTEGRAIAKRLHGTNI